MHGQNKERCGRRTILRGQRRIESPAKVGAATLHKQRADKQRKSKWHDPEAPVIHPGQGHIRSTDHHWNHPISQSHKSGHYRPKDHNQTMHGGHLIKKLWTYKLQAWLEQLGPNHHSHRATQQKHGKAKPHIHRTDIFVIGGQHPTTPTLHWAVVVGMFTHYLASS